MIKICLYLLFLILLYSPHLEGGALSREDNKIDKYERYKALEDYIDNKPYKNILIITNRPPLNIPEFYRAFRPWEEIQKDKNDFFKQRKEFLKPEKEIDEAIKMMKQFNDGSFNEELQRQNNERKARRVARLNEKLMFTIFSSIVVFIVVFCCLLCKEVIKSCTKSKDEAQCETEPFYSTEQPPPYSEISTLNQPQTKYSEDNALYMRDP